MALVFLAPFAATPPPAMSADAAGEAGTQPMQMRLLGPRPLAPLVPLVPLVQQVQLVQLAASNASGSGSSCLRPEGAGLHFR